MNPDRAYKIIKLTLEGFYDLDSSRIKAEILKLSTQNNWDFPSEILEGFAKKFERTNQYQMKIGQSISTPSVPWLEDHLASINFYYWNRYRELLERNPNLGEKVCKTLATDTKNILGLLENPLKEGSWLKKGMVVGHVQAGKTSNYTGVITRAADAGYRIVIVLAGIQNNLRMQTQQRIDEGFIGKTLKEILPGQTKFIDTELREIDSERMPTAKTSALSDFNKNLSQADQTSLNSLKEPMILVIKKNGKVLESLISWLKDLNSHSDSIIYDLPALIIDDESDHASVNTNSSDSDPTKINDLIRKLLSLFAQRSYIGYTATPFANVFIDQDSADSMVRDDLFPSDFIYSLDSPTNYFGPELLFSGDGNTEILSKVNDYQDFLPLDHKQNIVIGDIPPSLKKAIRCFLLNEVVRTEREIAPYHHTMMVNVSRFNLVQQKVKTKIREYVASLEKRLELYGQVGLSQSIEDRDISSILETWDSEFQYIDTPFNPDSLIEKCAETIKNIKVLLVNQGSSDILDYSRFKRDGLKVIAVGGLSLSRGLTLEGLSISYFLRNSKMYDTLMQMCRWFGYRDTYKDLCKVFLTRSSIEHYCHITEVLEELHSDFNQMVKENKKPVDFALKVRSHPASLLLVTAANKMKSATKFTMGSDFQLDVIENYRVLSSSKDKLYNQKINEELVKNLLKRHKPLDSPLRNYLWRDVPVDLIDKFLYSYKTEESIRKTKLEAGLQYIKDRENDELQFWNVLLVNNTQAKSSIQVCDIKVGKGVRSIDQNYKYPEKLSLSSKARIGGGEEKDVLEFEIQKKIEKIYLKDNPGKSVPDREYRKHFQVPLFILYVFDAIDEDEVVETDIFTFLISFPPSDIPVKEQTYYINQNLLTNVFGTRELDNMEDI